MTVKPVLSTRLYEQVHADLLGGRWKPGSRLQAAAIAEQYSTSTTVVRETLSLLAGEKLLTVIPNRGFFVPNLSLAELRDLTEVRCRTEGLALELAIERGDLAWESRVIAAHHTLAGTPRSVTAATATATATATGTGTGTDPHADAADIAAAWSHAHRAFHATLIEACGVDVLLGICRQLGDTTEIYRRWSAHGETLTARDIEREHSDLLAAVLHRDSGHATTLLAAHYRATASAAAESGLIAAR